MFDFPKYFVHFDRKQNLPVVREYILRATKGTFECIWNEKNILLNYYSAALKIFAQSKIIFLDLASKVDFLNSLN